MACGDLRLPAPCARMVPNPQIYQGEKSLETLDLAHLIVDAVADKQGEDIVLLDIKPVSLIADYFIISSANTDRQIKAIADEVIARVKVSGIPPLHVEGDAESGWVLLDYGGVIVHLLSPEMRAYYTLEDLWNRAPIVLRMQ
jgi:ribosome-associated protein